MAITIKHAKTDTIADWTQSDLDAQIALGNFPAGTVLADIVLPSDWNNDHTISGTVPIANGGTGQTTANAAINALLPSQSGNSGKVLSTNGADTSWISAGGTGTVTSVSVTSANGFAGTVANPTTTPAITLSTSVTGLLKGNGTSISAATSGTDYAPATSGTSILYGNGSGGFSNVTVGSGLSFSTGTLSATGSMVYPGAGIPNSTGSAWGTSYTTSGSGTVVALATGASLTTPTQVSYETWTSIAAPTYAEGKVWYDSTRKALSYYNDSSTTMVHMGQDIQTKVINNTGSTIPNGSPVYITSTSSGQIYPNVALAKADVAATAAVIGLTNGAISNGSIGYVTSQGACDDINTSSYTVGQVLYLSPYSAGQLMNTVPPTGLIVQVGVVSYVNASAGSIYVKQTQPLVLASTQGGTGLSSYTAGDTLYYSTGNTLTKLGIGTAGQVLTVNSGATAPQWSTPAAGTVTSVTGTAPIASTGGATPAISISQSSATTDGYLSSVDWNTFNNKQPAGTYVTSVSATSPVTSTGGTTPTIAMPAATTSVSGYLTSTDWNTFNNKQPAGSYLTSVTADSPLSGSGTSASHLVISQANTSTNGYLSSTDWNTFNNKGSGTVTSVAALTLGTTGTDLSSTVATGTTTPVITLNVPTASSANRGALSSTDWTTFNGKQAALVSGTNIKTVNGTTLLGSGDLGTITVAYGGTGVSSASITAFNNITGYTASGATGTTSTNIVFSTNPTITNPTVTNYVESVVTIGTVTTSNTLSLTNGTMQTATLTASTACTFTMPTATAGKSFTLLLKQAASTGNGTATFTGVKWPAAGTPTMTATAGKMDIFTFVADGTNWYGSYIQGYTP